MCERERMLQKMIGQMVRVQNEELIIRDFVGGGTGWNMYGYLHQI